MPFFSRSGHKKETIKHKEFIKMFALYSTRYRITMIRSVPTLHNIPHPQRNIPSHIIRKISETVQIFSVRGV